MRKASRVLVACLIASLAPSPAFAWGSAAHRYITRRAIDLLPPELKPFFEHHRDEIVLRSTDPDVWRTAGWEDDPNHFINFGVPEFGPYPFTALPRDLGAAIEKFGTATLRKDGMLPWRAQEEFGNLRRAFEGFTRHAGYAPGDVVLFAAVAAHYVQDAGQPLHATTNYDGQLTGQYGVHSRFESALFERFESKMTITPAAPAAIANIRDEMFDILLKSYRLVDPVLAADKAAIAGKDTYDDAYFDAFFAGVRPVIERQLAASITRTAALWLSAWEQAGRPAVAITMPRTPQKGRTPGAPRGGR